VQGVASSVGRCYRQGGDSPLPVLSCNTGGYLALLQHLNAPIRRVICISSPTISPATAVGSFGTGWPLSRASSTPSFPSARSGSISSKTGEDGGRLFQRKAFAVISVADADDSAYATRIATAHLNHHAKPGVWERPPPSHPQLRRCFVYCL